MSSERRGGGWGGGWGEDATGKRGKVWHRQEKRMNNRKECDKKRDNNETYM
jgi:hypothetical protein